MSAENNEFEQLLNDSGSLVSIHNGQIVEGTVIDVKEDEIILNINYKCDGIITRDEYSNQSGIDLTELVKVGDTITAKVLKVNDSEGQVFLTYKRLAAEKSNEKIKEAFENGEVLTAKVEKVSQGLQVIVDETRVFIPASLVSDTFEKNLDKYLGQEVSFKITEFNPKKRRIIGDRKSLVEAEKKKLHDEALERLNVNDVVKGTVKNLTDFGAFIDLGGIDGLLHISEMSWGRIENPKKVFQVGQEIEVLIKDIKGEKIALTLKFPDKNPWANASEKYAKGNVVTGKVARMADFGAFIELEDGIDALLHVSQISRERIDKPADVLSVGQEVEAKVVDFNEPDHKISLSIKALLNDRANDEEDEADDAANTEDEVVYDSAEKAAPVEEAPAEEAPAEEAPAEEAPAEETPAEEEATEE
ncbi:MAG: 30S ribosomal protein S1 [Lachnospiraceae bacterium]|nr:30S ribosomal protein S1 [Lachnospiraceae bacterium]